MEVVIMSYSSKRNIVSVVTGTALIVAYVIYAMGASAPATEDIRAWAVAVLIFIGIGAGIQIVVQIIFHISLAIRIAIKEEVKTEGVHYGKTTERILKSEMVEDEWSKIIGLKASRIGAWLVLSGVIAALISLAAGAQTVIALHVLFGASMLAGIAEGVSCIIYHERGVR
jgi:hypothetical protein